jgi:hypothetical protein
MVSRPTHGTTVASPPVRPPAAGQGIRETGRSADFRKENGVKLDSRFLPSIEKMERETGVEPATSSLGN